MINANEINSNSNSNSNNESANRSSGVIPVPDFDHPQVPDRMNCNHPDNNNSSNCEGDLAREVEDERHSIGRHEGEEHTSNNGSQGNHTRERHSSENDGSSPAITTFTQKTPSFAIQQLLGLTSSGSSNN